MNKGYIYIIIATILFSSMEVALKLAGGLFHPVQITFLRFLIGSLILMPLAMHSLRKKHITLTLKDMQFYGMSGFVFIVVSMILYQLALGYGEASVVAVLFSSNPVFVIIFAYFMLKEPISKYNVATLVLSMLGIIAIMNPTKINGNELSMGLIMLSSSIFAFYGVLGRKKSLSHGGVAMTSFSFIFGSLELLLLITLTNIQPIANLFINAGLEKFAYIPSFSGVNMASLPQLAYIGVGVTGIGFASYFMAMEATSAAEASLVFFIKPVLAPIFALVILGTPITLNMVLGIILMVIGSGISLVPKLKNAKSK